MIVNEHRPCTLCNEEIERKIYKLRDNKYKNKT